jgi:hypothetical protein
MLQALLLLLACGTAPTPDATPTPEPTATPEPTPFQITGAAADRMKRIAEIPVAPAGIEKELQARRSEGIKVIARDLYGALLLRLNEVDASLTEEQRVQIDPALSQIRKKLADLEPRVDSAEADGEDVVNEILLLQTQADIAIGGLLEFEGIPTEIPPHVRKAIEDFQRQQVGGGMGHDDHDH